MSGGANMRPPLLDLPPRKLLACGQTCLFAYFYFRNNVELIQMFQPPPPLEFKPPIARKECTPYSGVASFMSLFEQTPPPPREYFEPPAERKKRFKEQLNKLNEEKIDLMLSDWNPHANSQATG